MIINIVDDIFKHSKTISNPFNVNNSSIIYNRDIKYDQEYDFLLITDNNLHEVDLFNAKIKIAWLIESPIITIESYQYIKENHNKFDYILTFDKELLSISDKFKFLPCGGSWIESESQMIHPKKKLCSIVASSKNQTEGQKLRHEVIKKYGNMIDIYGYGYNPINFKSKALNEYYFNIVIENTKKDYYFSEKLIDTFITGTIPIYWGSDISKYFDISGVINFNDFNFNNLSSELYYSKIQNVNNNFGLSKNYINIENNLLNILKYKLIKK